jgi:hypothetical protein
MVAHPKDHIFICFWYLPTSQLAKDLLHPLPEEERRKHKKKRLVQHPNSFFMDVKCPGKMIPRLASNV